MPAGEDTSRRRSVSADGRPAGQWARAGLVLCLLLLSESPALAYAPQKSLGQAKVCGALSAPDKNGQVLCRDPRTTFAAGDDVCMLVRFKDSRNHRRYRAVAYRNGKEQRRYTSEEVSGLPHTGDDVWAHCEKHIALPGEWRFELFVDRGRGGFERLSAAQFTVETDASYRFVDAATCSFIGSVGGAGEVPCLGRTDRFLPGEPAHMWVKLAGVTSDHRFLVKTFRGDEMISQRHTYWRKADATRKNTFFVPTEYNTTPGHYRSEFFIDTGEGFKLVGERAFAVDVLAPVKGPLEANCVWPSDPTVWAFCKHRRRSSRGVAAADDTRAWDVNLPRYADAGKPVYPMAPGRVVRYGGDLEPGSGPMAGVLIEHKTPGGALWWTGYLHMRRDSIRVKLGQLVDVSTQLGVIGKTGASNNHLHVAVYDGKNELGGLNSLEVAFRSRDEDGSVPVVVARRRDRGLEALRP
jgi:hypothetical protein